MNGVSQMKQLLFEELELIVRTTAGLIRKVSPQDADYRPGNEMRTLLELMHHLVSVPSVDLLILQENTEQVIREQEALIAEAGADAERLIEWMTSGLQAVKAYMESLSEEDFLNKKTKPFYLEHASTQAKWLIEIVTHAQHHRAQLFTYMKSRGYTVNMFDLY